MSTTVAVSRMSTVSVLQSLLEKEHDALTSKDKQFLLRYCQPNSSVLSVSNLEAILSKPSAQLNRRERADWLAFKACLAVRMEQLREAEQSATVAQRAFA